MDPQKPHKKPRGRYRWHFGHEDELQKIEWFDPPNTFRQKCKELASMIKDADYVVVYTGAGISTSAKLPDYRGKEGMWTHRDAGTTLDTSKYVANISCALPTLAHMAIAELARKDRVDFVVSTNVDGLHMRSGLPRGKLAELHGNAYLEKCDKCGKKYLHDRDVLQNQSPEHRGVNRHWCGGRCEQEGCDGLLLDNIVAFGENLPVDQLESGREHSSKGDLAVVLGTTMMVQPACLLPELIYKKKEGKMVICNLQKTQYDKHADLVIHGHIDDVLHLVMQALGIEISSSSKKIPVPYYVDGIDAKHRQKIQENKEKLEEIERRKREDPDSLKGNALTRGENMYTTNDISKHGETRDVTFHTLECIFIHDCKGCTYTIQSKTKKIIILDCQDMNITVNEKVLTGTLEVINSSSVSLHINVAVHTVTCDNSNTVSVNFKDYNCFHQIAWAKVVNPSMSIAGSNVNIVTSKEVDLDKAQVVTHQIENGDIVSETTQRDHCGRITKLV